MTEALSLRKAHLPLKISQEQELILTLDECSSHRNTSEVKGALGWWTKKASSFAKNEAKPPGHFKPHCLYMDIMSIKSILLTGYCSVWQAGNLMSKPPPTSCSMFECFGSDTFTPLQAFVLPARHCLCFWCITSYFLFHLTTWFKPKHSRQIEVGTSVFPLLSVVMNAWLYTGQLRKCCLSPSILHSVSQAYSLNDYNQLQLNVTLRGLGPDYKAAEEAVSPGLLLQGFQDFDL